jgi:hypothetical protein
MLHRGVIYLTGVRNAETDAMVIYYGDMLPLGMMVTPIFTKSRESYERYVPLYNWIGIDNGCFSRPDAFHLKSYLGMISRVAGMTERISFATAPDVFDIVAGRGNWPATLAKSLPVLPLIRKAGAPAAIVLQDGATSKTVPWGEIDAVFVGASTRWKLSEACRQICLDARRRGKWVHMGRVNSLRRMRLANRFRCHSVDGTYLRYPDSHVMDVADWLRTVWADEMAANPDVGNLYYDGCEV